MKIVYQCLITKYYPPAFRSLNSIPNPSHILLFWNRWLEIRITKWESRTIFGSKMRTALHACWLALDTHVFTARFICGPKCPALSSNIFFGTMSKRKISSYFGIERGKTIDQDEKKKKTNSHMRNNREKKMMLNFRIRNLAISTRNDWMITSGYGLKRKEESQNLNYLPLLKTLYATNIWLSSVKEKME